MSKLNFVDYMSWGSLITIASVMGYGAYNAHTRIPPVKAHSILQIRELSDNDEKPGLDTMILENGKSIQVGEKDNKLYILEK